MENAMALAQKCWNKTMAKEPSFAEQYIELAEQLLLSKPVVIGDEFRAYCAKNGLFRPATLHPNVWVSGVRALQNIGWIHHTGYTVPTKTHNHMPRVSLWTSMIYGKEE